MSGLQILQADADRDQDSPDRVVFSTCLSCTQVSSVIMGATKVSQLEDNLGALDIAAKMNDHIMQRIDTILKNKPAAIAVKGAAAVAEAKAEDKVEDKAETSAEV